MSHSWSFYDLTPPSTDPSLFLNDTGVSASEDVFSALVTTLHEALDTFAAAHPDLTWSDCIHAVKCLAASLEQDYAEDLVDA